VDLRTAGNNALMSKQKMLAARELIQEKRYAEARALLKTIDDPKAKEWLKKLDEIAPEKKSRKWLDYAIGGVLGLVIIVIAGVLVLRQNNATPTSQNAVAEVPTQMELPLSTPDLELLSTGEFSTETLTAVAAFLNPTLTAIAPTLNAFNSTLDPCSSSDWWDNEAIPLITRFFDTAEVAVSTSRMALSPTLLEMRQTQRSFENLVPPDCEREIFRELSTAMDYAVEGLTDFLGESEALMDIHLSWANENFYTAYLQRDMIFVLNGELRLAYPHLIWGGNEVNEATATALYSSNKVDTNLPSDVELTATAVVRLNQTVEVQLRLTQTQARDFEVSILTAEAPAGTFSLEQSETSITDESLHTPTPSPNMTDLAATQLAKDFVLTATALAQTAGQ
jgi:hypothetical protein